ncbi:hypothetical protein [Mucilaginibacter sp. dw_454]|uniref:hypothetical protein n=1 Tax=Mucilaginibacter sp. dw_454 TaxID=2720079 RepID=UPI001BD29E6B|nr:hypothetical protein [Mucilaginibacter sp. dw_454]
MGEYVNYKGNEIKVGTMDNLYYVTYEKYSRALAAGLLSKLDGSSAPAEYARPDSGFCFRFPFPDEDKLPLGDIGRSDYNRGLPVKIDPGIYNGAGDGSLKTVEIVQQKLVHREQDGKLILALLLRDPADGNKFRIEDDAFIGKFCREIIRNHVMNEKDKAKKEAYRQVASIISKGYHHSLPKKKTQIKRRGKGLR